MEDKHEAHDPREQSRFWKWLDNFWYHYKWQAIAVAAVVILLAVTLPQCAKGGDSITVAFAGSYTMNSEEKKALEDVLRGLSVDDTDITLAQHSIYTEQDLTEMFTYYDKEREEYRVDIASKNSAKGYNTDRIRTLQNYIMTGDCGVWIVSPYVFETMFDGKTQVVSQCRLGDLAVYQTYDALQILSPDCLVILTRSVMGETSREKEFVKVQAYYNAIVNFSMGEGKS